MTIETSIRLRCNAALEKGWSVGLFRTPDGSGIKLFISQKLPELLKVDLSKITQKSFVFAPYGSGNLAYVLLPDYLYENERTIVEKDVALHKTTSEKTQWHIGAAPSITTSKEHYTSYVKQTVESIQKGHLLKSVAARNKVVPFPKNYDLLNHFHEMCEHFPNAHVYLFSSAVAGTWIGATPELLLSCTDTVLKTVALAGTKKTNDLSPWTDKENKEHYFVEAFIDDVFEELKLRQVTLSEIGEKTAGQIKHLHSVFTWKTTVEEMKKKFHKILALINPTPAVCGLPPMEAAIFISRHEQIERRFYSGFTGVVDGTKNTQLYVTLRCMEILQDQLLLYAGAGITAESVPENEWLETEHKMQTLGVND